MSSNNQQPFDPEQFKAQQQKMWDGVAAGWQSWWQTFEEGANRVSDKLVQMADLKPGDKVLDIATGIGEPAVTAARRVGAGGKVMATDLSTQMISIAKSRAKSLGLDDVMEFRVSDAENLMELQSASFNAVLSRWGLMFLPNLSRALGSIRQLLVPGGRFAAAVWSGPAKVPILDLPYSIVRKEINVPPPPKGTPGPFALADVEALKNSFQSAGFREIRVEAIETTFRFDSAESFTRFQQQVAAPINALLAKESDEKRKQTWDALTNATKEKFGDSSGRVSFTNEAICIAGTN